MKEYITEDLRSSVNDFYRALKRKFDEDADSNEAIFDQILLAITDFDVFIAMMKEKAESLSRK